MYLEVANDLLALSDFKGLMKALRQSNKMTHLVGQCLVNVSLQIWCHINSDWHSYREWMALESSTAFSVAGGYLVIMHYSKLQLYHFLNFNLANP